jgi:hypothetical protein
MRLVRRAALGVFQIRGVEALGEPAVDFSEHHARFVEAALLLASNFPFAN